MAVSIRSAVLFCKDSFWGRTALWKIFWLGCVVPRIVFLLTFIAIAIFIGLNEARFTLFMYVGILMAAIQWYCLWHNAANTLYRPWEYVVRIIVLLELGFVIWLAEFYKVSQDF